MQRQDLIKSQKSFLNIYRKEKSWKNFESTKKIFWLHCAKVKSSLDARWTSIVKHCECVSVETLMPTSLLPQFYIQLAYKPHFWIWFLLFGLFGQLRAVRKKIFEFLWFFWATLRVVFSTFCGQQNFNFFFRNIVGSALKSYIITL